MLGDFLAAMKGAGAGRASLAEALTQAMQEMNRRLGLRQRAVLAADVGGGALPGVCASCAGAGGVICAGVQRGADEVPAGKRDSERRAAMA